MSAGEPGGGVEPPIRERYEEYRVGSLHVAVIADPENDRAWIVSDATRPIDP